MLKLFFLLNVSFANKSNKRGSDYYGTVCILLLPSKSYDVWCLRAKWGWRIGNLISSDCISSSGWNKMWFSQMMVVFVFTVTSLTKDIYSSSAFERFWASFHFLMLHTPLRCYLTGNIVQFRLLCYLTAIVSN